MLRTGRSGDQEELAVPERASGHGIRTTAAETLGPAGALSRRGRHGKRDQKIQLTPPTSAVLLCSRPS